jgi:hypothetical protein
MSENRRLEASMAADDRGPFPAKWGGENAETSRERCVSREATRQILISFFILYCKFIFEKNLFF